MLKERRTFARGRPVEIEILEALDYPIHHHDAFEIILVLEGTVVIKDGYYVATVKKDDLWFVDSNDLHSISQTQGSNKLLIMHMDLDYFQTFFPDIKKTFFASILDAEDEESLYALRTIREQILNLSLGLLHGGENAYHKVADIPIQILNKLIHDFQFFSMIDGRFINESRNKNNHAMFARIMRIIQYIYDNYARNLTLNEIAEKEHLNVYYLSHIIKDTTQMNFRDLLNMVRVENSEKMLLSTDKKIPEIAIECGFSANRYYLDSFKKWYYMHPEDYRKIYRPKSAQLTQGSKRHIEHTMYESIIKSYATHGRLGIDGVQEDEIFSVEVDMNESGISFEHPLQNALTLTDVASLIRDEINETIKTMKRDFRLVKFFINADYFSDIEQESGTFVTIARNINYLLEEDIHVIIFAENVNDTSLKTLENFLFFYNRRFSKNVSEISFHFIADSEAEKGNCESWGKKFEAHIVKRIGFAPDIEYLLRESVPVTFAECLYDSYVLAPFAIDELLCPENWNMTMDCTAIDSVKSDGNIFEGGHGLATWR